MSETPRVYVACLASYNHGNLYGAWVDVPSEPDELLESIKEILESSPTLGAEEWAFHDSEGFYQLDIGEYESVDAVCAKAKLIAEHGELGSLLFDYTSDFSEAERLLSENYLGAWKDLEDWAEEYLDETLGFREIPDLYKSYFDYARYARDLELSGDLLIIETAEAHHLFWSH